MRAGHLEMAHIGGAGYAAAYLDCDSCVEPLVTTQGLDGTMGYYSVLTVKSDSPYKRRFFDVLRGVDVMIWALVFVRAIGLGPLAGIMAIAVSDTGTLSKLFSEAIENIEPKEMEGVKAAGGNQVTVVRFGVMPQVLPVMLSFALYMLESNTRSATILGLVGAGGIGLLLADRIRAHVWDQALVIILLILLTVYVIDFLSKKIRERLIGKTDQGTSAKR